MKVTYITYMYIMNNAIQFVNDYRINFEYYYTKKIAQMIYIHQYSSVLYNIM